jgi:predicted nucleic acid-binding protein
LLDDGLGTDVSTHLFLDAEKKYGHIKCMAMMTVKSTYSLDLDSVQALDEIAQRWKVSAFTAKHAAEGAGIFNASGRKLGSFADCMIGAVAIAAGARLATSNLADFRRLHHPGLVIAFTSD